MKTPKLNIEAMAVATVNAILDGQKSYRNDWRMLSSIEQAALWFTSAMAQYEVRLNDLILASAKTKDKVQSMILKNDADTLEANRPKFRKDLLDNFNKTKALPYLPTGHSLGYLAKQGFVLKETAVRKPAETDNKANDDTARAAQANSEKFNMVALELSAAKNELETYKAWVHLLIAQAKAANLELIAKPAPKAANVVTLVKTKSKSGSKVSAVKTGTDG
jgi:hypothetical protein